MAALDLGGVIIIADEIFSINYYAYELMSEMYASSYAAYLYLRHEYEIY